MRKTVTQLASVAALGCSVLFYLLAGCSPAPKVRLKEITINADDKMKFDVTAFEAKPGQKISVTLINVGTTPKFSMGHNFVVLDRNVNIQNFLDAASMHAAHDYVPPEFEKKGVIAHTTLLGPGESSTVNFSAPYVPGDYPFFCSFPGHYSQDAKGVMTVKQ
jgi:azurin